MMVLTSKMTTCLMVVVLFYLRLILGLLYFLPLFRCCHDALHLVPWVLVSGLPRFQRLQRDHHRSCHHYQTPEKEGRVKSENHFT